jgi:hypothetical protein
MFNPLKAYLLKRFYLYVLGQKSSRLGLNSIEISWIKKKKKAKEIKFYLYLALRANYMFEQKFKFNFFMYFNRFHIYAGIKNKLKNIILI